MIVIWLPRALDDVHRIEEERGQWSQRSADRLAAAFFNHSERLGVFPNSGRMIPEFQMPHLREVIEQGYRVFYQVFEDRIEVFGVVHSRQDVFRDA
ncbi:MAG: type II toxin-antitoxin system RelE/ParE family toxin [Dehalococcoidia bacterium]